jgi:hypothetical protein
MRRYSAERLNPSGAVWMKVKKEATDLVTRGVKPTDASHHPTAYNLAKQIQLTPLSQK